MKIKSLTDAIKQFRDNIEDSDYKVKRSFNPLKIFQLNANQ